MNLDRIQGDWKQFAGKIKIQWGKLTDYDLIQINGKEEELEGKIQERYGYAKEKIKKDIEAWRASLAK